LEILVDILLDVFEICVLFSALFVVVVKIKSSTLSSAVVTVAKAEEVTVATVAIAAYILGVPPKNETQSSNADVAPKTLSTASCVAVSFNASSIRLIFVAA